MQEQTEKEIETEAETTPLFAAAVSSNAKDGEEDRAKARARIIYRVSIISLVVNCLLTAFKLFAGIFAHSMAMISDAVHSGSDVFSTFIVILGVAIASKASDEKHPYGHERFECVAAIVLAVVLGGTGVALGYSGVKTLINRNYGSIAIPGTLALVAAAVSIVVKEGMFWVTHLAAKKVQSGALRADAWHHRSDALSSIGALLGILGAKLGFPIFDPIASLVICLFILKAAFSVFMDAVRKMTDEACDSETAEKINAVIEEVEGVDDIDKLITRKFGDRIYVEAEISVNGDLPLREAHTIAKHVHDRIEASFREVKHVSVHVNPTDHGEDD